MVRCLQEYQPCRVACPGGRCSTIAVGGLALGGGLSFYLGKVGFVADNVLNFEVVLASGAIVNANKSSHSDLFIALKGGSSNSGIVTRFDIEAFEDSGKVWGGGILSITNTDTAYESLHEQSRFTENSDLCDESGAVRGGGIIRDNPMDATYGSLKGLYDFTENNHLDEDAALATIFSYNTTTGQKVVLTSLVYTKDVEDPKIFRHQLSLPYIFRDTGFTTVAEMSTQVSTFLPWGYRSVQSELV